MTARRALRPRSPSAARCSNATRRRETVSLTSIFLAPAALFFLFTIPVVVLLYLLKLRRTEVIISSTLLWRKSLQDLTANAPFQRLRRNLLLFLQVLILLLTVTALSRPFVEAEGTRGNYLCVILDLSASMQAKEGEQTRLDLAKEQALALVDTMERGDRMMVISFADSADVLCELTENKHRLREAIQAVAARDTESRIHDVMSIMRSLAPDNPDVTAVVPELEMVLFSDGRLSDLDQVGTFSRRIHYVSIGTASNNAGIVRFSVRRANEGLGARQAFLLLYNDADAPVQTTLSLNVGDSLLAVEELNVPARGTQEALFELPELEEGILHATLDLDDALAVDNQAWVALQHDAYLHVLLVSAPEAMGAYFLRKVLALDPRVELSTVTPENYSDSAEPDLIIFNGWTPGSLPSQSLLFFNALPPISGLVQQGELENPPVLATDKRHPLMRFLNPGNLRVGKALRLTLPDGAQSLMSTQGSALIAEVSQGNQQILVSAFDLADTNWPLHLSFPLFIQNLISWIPRSALGEQQTLAGGQPIEILPIPEVEQASVTTPGGVTHIVPLEPVRPTYFGETSQAGPYRVTVGEQTLTYAVNLLDQNESAIRPAQSLPVGEGEIAATETAAQRYNKDLWPWFAAVGLLLLCLEWWIFCYRAHI
ncbi:MAG: VWA domain-containing protein [Candidatus Hydrogenedentes bacterium]|nr:VWA domain-containing protein [Candidatus Hydrogenedentota bacterium]